MPKRLAPLLPAEVGGARFPLDSPREDPSKRKRVGTDVACNPCRRRKTRCDGIRPVCAACRKRSTECTFVEKKESPRPGQSPEGSYEVLELLKSAPEPQAFEILRLLRTNGDPDSVLNIIKGGQNGIKQPSDKDTGCTIRSTQSALEFEVMVRNPIAYPALRHAPMATLERDGLLMPRRLRRSNLPVDANHVFSVDIPLEGISDESRQSNPLLCDERLKDLKINFWTDVSMTHDYAAKLTTDNPLLGLFDSHLFISNLVSRRHGHRSRYLQIHTAIDKRTVRDAENSFMVLFGFEPSQALKEIGRIPRQTQRASSYTAWGILDWAV
ncbi:hypothetical protein LZ30DRAFT_745579 [Colletotrichum cereale]|nr:hypothetical protein LZ30DRAFT_745579 [Colletotrichum cereale]